MVATSQKPILNRLLECDPLVVRGRSYENIDHAIADLGKGLTSGMLINALSEHGVEVSHDTLYRWRRQAE